MTAGGASGRSTLTMFSAEGKTPLARFADRRDAGGSLPCSCCRWRACARSWLACRAAASPSPAR